VNVALPARETPANLFESTLALGPERLYTLAASLGISRVVHVTDEAWRGIETASRLASARYAERALARQNLDWSVLAIAAETTREDIARAIERLLGMTSSRRRFNLDNRDDAIALLDAPAGHRDDALVVLFDGACPLCFRAMSHLADRDRARRLSFRDLAVPGNDASHYGVDRVAAMALLHVIRPDGTLLIGMEAIREVYSTVGAGGPIALTGLPGVRPLVDRAYAFLARHRFVASRLLGVRCNSVTCALPVR
ncbi:MAG: DUF393 domain-containing protein, partial [Burkholderiales bacterium]